MMDRTIRRVGRPCWLYPRAGSANRTRGVFSTRTEVDASLGGAPIARRLETLTLTSDDGAAMQTGDRVIVNETEYGVDAVDAGTGAVTLVLGTWREPGQ